MSNQRDENAIKKSFDGAFYAKEYDFFTPTSDLVSLEVIHTKITAWQMQMKLPLKIHPLTKKPFLSFIIPICMDRISKSDIFSPDKFINLLQNLDRAFPEMTLVIDIVPTGELSAWNILRDDMLMDMESENTNNLLGKIKSGENDVKIDSARAKGRKIAEEWVESISSELVRIRSNGHVVEIIHWAEFIRLDHVDKIKNYYLGRYRNKTSYLKEFKSIVFAIMVKVKSQLIKSKTVLPPRIANPCIVQYITEELAVQCYIVNFLKCKYDYHLYEKDDYSPLLTNAALRHARRCCRELGYEFNSESTLQFLEFKRITEKFDLEEEYNNSMMYHYFRLRGDTRKGKKLSDCEKEFQKSMSECERVASFPKFHGARTLFKAIDEKQWAIYHYNQQRHSVLDSLRFPEVITEDQKNKINEYLLPRSRSSRFSFFRPEVNVDIQKIRKKNSIPSRAFLPSSFKELHFILPIWIDRAIDIDYSLLHWVETFLECLCGTYEGKVLILDLVLVKEIYTWDTVRDMLLSKARRNKMSEVDVKNFKHNENLSSIPAREFVMDYVEKQFKKIRVAISQIINGLNQLGHRISIKYFSDIVDQEKLMIIKNNLHNQYQSNREYRNKFKTVSHKMILRVNWQLLKRGRVQPEIANHYNYHYITEKLATIIYMTKYCTEQYDYGLSDVLDQDILLLRAFIMEYEKDFFRQLTPLDKNLEWIECNLPEDETIYRNKVAVEEYRRVPEWLNLESNIKILRLDESACGQYFYAGFLSVLMQTRIAFWNLVEEMAQLHNEDYSSEDLADPAPVELINVGMGQYPTV
ncbi:MAG: hypothetical protein K2X50_03725 [Gammaproteobacteria bacterium]|nr:hypothetical protein [Gammaproteobacteria bacterium]